MSEHYKTLSAIFPVILKIEEGNTSILLHRRQNTGYQDGKWDIAGSGHVDKDETAKSAVIRESKEELGIEVKADDLTFIHLSHRFTADKTYYDIYFVVGRYTGEPSIMEPDKCSALSWFNINNLPDNMIACRREALQNYINKVYYSEQYESM